MISINFMFIYLNLCSTKGVFRVELYDIDTQFSHFQNKFFIEVNFSSFLAKFQFRAEVKKVTSRAEPSWKFFSSSYGSDSSLKATDSFTFRVQIVSGSRFWIFILIKQVKNKFDSEP